MNTLPALEKCQAFLASQFQSANRFPQNSDTTPRHAVTISRQAGCGAHAIGSKLAEYLQAHGPKGAAAWTVFDRNLVEKVLEDHSLPQRLAKFMPEDRISQITDAVEELFGLHPPSWILVRQIAETVLHLAEMGNVILIGRGANVITHRLSHVFHVRLIAPFETRLERVVKYEQLDRKAARAFIRRADSGRERYLKKYFHKDLNDPLLYHLVINTDVVSLDQAARLIGDAVLAS